MIKLISIFIIFMGFLSSEIIPQNNEKLEISGEYKLNSDSTLTSDTINFSVSLIKEKKYKYPGRAMLLSGLIPGLGELYSGNPIKAFAFAGIEAGAWYFWNKQQDKMLIQEKAYKNYADDHWDFERWVRNYYNYYNFQDEFLNTFEFYKLFSNIPNGIPTMFGSYNSNFNQIEEWVDINNNSIQDEGEIIEWNYTHINDGSHSIAFYDPRYDEIKTFPNDPPSLESNGYFYCSYFDNSSNNCNTFELSPEFEEILSEVYVQKNLHFYENIGKYNQFFMGWDDAVLTQEALSLTDNISNIGIDISNFVVTADSMMGPINSISYDITDKFDYNPETGKIELVDPVSSDYENFQIMYTKASIFDNEGYIVPKSPNKWTYRDLRDEYNNIGKMAGYAMTSVMFNHVISMIDAVITTNIYNREGQQSRVTAEPILDLDTKYGVGGIRLNYRF
jgi:hypothetical protein